MLCAPAIGRARARAASTPSSTSASAGPRAIRPGSPSVPRCLASRVARLLSHFLWIVVYSFTIMPNLKFALRTLFKTPFVTIVAIVSLALGIGANAAIFSLFNQVLLKPLPVPEPTLGVKPEVFAPITMRGFSQPFKGFDNRRSYWAYLFARLKPGISIEQARTAMATPYRTIVNDVERRCRRTRVR